MEGKQSNTPQTALNGCKNDEDMKLTAEMKDRIRTFVEKNGLYPQPCGATQQQLFEACGFGWDSLKRWQEKADFAEMLTRARAKFAQQTEIEIVNAMKKAALGMQYTKEVNEATAQKVVEYDPKTGKKAKEYTTDQLVAKSAKRETVVIPPDVKAGIFMLTNLAPEKWKQKQDVSGSLSLLDDEQPAPEIVFE